MLVIKVADTVFQDLSITITILIILVDQLLLIFLPALRCKLLSLEERRQFACLVGLGESTLGEESTLDLAVREFLVSIDGNLMNFDFLLLIHHHIQDDLSLVGNIVTLVDLDIGILESFVIEIFLGKNLGTIQHIRSHLGTFHHTQFLLHVLTLALLQANIVDIGDARTHCQIDMQINLLPHDGVGSNSDLGEQSMLPIALHCICNFIARYIDSISDSQARDTRKHIIFISFHSRHIDATNEQATWIARIRDVGIHDLVLCLHLCACHCGEEQDENLFYLIHLSYMYFSYFDCSFSTCASVLPKRRWRF